MRQLCACRDMIVGNGEVSLVRLLMLFQALLNCCFFIQGQLFTQCLFFGRKQQVSIYSDKANHIKKVSILVSFKEPTRGQYMTPSDWFVEGVAGSSNLTFFQV